MRDFNVAQWLFLSVDHREDAALPSVLTTGQLGVISSHCLSLLASQAVSRGEQIKSEGLYWAFYSTETHVQEF